MKFFFFNYIYTIFYFDLEKSCINLLSVNFVTQIILYIKNAYYFLYERQF